jgi:hypothetical protein
LCTAQKQIQDQLAASQQLGNLATTTGALNTQCLNNLSTLGAQQQTILQNAQNYPMQQLTNESALLKGYTIPTSTSSKYCGPIPGAYNTSPLAQIAGLGSLATGLLGKCGISLSCNSALKKLISGGAGALSGAVSGCTTDSSGYTWGTCGSSDANKLTSCGSQQLICQYS